VSAASPQVPKKCKNSDWKLEDDPKFGDAILHSLMRIRTDSNQFTDTEIYALGYCGYSTAVFVLLHAGLIKQQVVGDREALQTQFANIMDGLLKPLPPDRWEKNLAFADSRFWARRTLLSANRRLARPRRFFIKRKPVLHFSAQTVTGGGIDLP
jgi:hypothetical protein